MIHCLVTFSEGHGVYLCVILSALLASLDLGVNLLSKEELRHFLVYVCSCGWGRYCDVLLTLYLHPDVLGIRALAPGIACQGLGGPGELAHLGSGPHVINVTLEVLCQHSERNYRSRSAGSAAFRNLSTRNG